MTNKMGHALLGIQTESIIEIRTEGRFYLCPGRQSSDWEVFMMEAAGALRKPAKRTREGGRRPGYGLGDTHLVPCVVPQ